MRIGVTSAVVAAATALTPQVVFANEGNISVVAAPDEVTVWRLPGVSNGSPDSNFRLEDLSVQEASVTAKKKLDIELEAAVWTGFTDADLFEQVEGPTQDLLLTVGLAPNLSLVVWNIQSIKLDPQVGDELYVAASFEQSLDQDFTLRLEAGRSWTEGFNAMWMLTGEVRYRAVDFTITEFVVDNGPRLDPEEGENATRFQLGYTLPEVHGIQARVMLTHEQGFGLPTITTVGVEAELPLTSRSSLRGEVFAPLFKEFGDDRKTAVMAGISYRF